MSNTVRRTFRKILTAGIVGSFADIAALSQDVKIAVQPCNLNSFSLTRTAGCLTIRSFAYWAAVVLSTVRRPAFAWHRG